MRIPTIFVYEIPEALSDIMGIVSANIYSRVGEFAENENREWLVAVTVKRDGVKDAFSFVCSSCGDFNYDSWEEDYLVAFSDSVPMNLRREKDIFYHGAVFKRKEYTEFGGCIKIAAGWLDKGNFRFCEELYKVVFESFKDAFSGKEIGIEWSEGKPFEK